MQLKLIALMFTAILVTGCGYKNAEECRMKEAQKCATKGCSYAAARYCAKEYPYKRDN